MWRPDPLSCNVKCGNLTPNDPCQMWRRDPKFPRLEKIDLQEGETVKIEIKEKNHRKSFLFVGYGKVLKYRFTPHAYGLNKPHQWINRQLYQIGLRKAA